MNIFTALREIGLDVEPREGPQQIRCPFHKGGNESSPSARVYEDSVYCFTCQESWNGYALIARSEGIDYATAYRRMKAKYGEELPRRKQVPLSKQIVETIDAVRVRGSRDELREIMCDVVARYASGESNSKVLDSLRVFRSKYFSGLS